MSMLSCPECGKRISSMAWTCPHCGTDIKGHLVECSNCGSYMLDSQNVCKQCGAKNEGYHERNASEEKQETAMPGDMRQDSGGHGGVWIAVIIVLILCVGGYYGYTYYREEAKAKEDAERQAAMELELSMQKEQARQWKAIADCDSIELLEQYVKENPDSRFAGFALDRIDSLRLRKAEIRCQELERKALQKAQEPEEQPQNQTEQTQEQPQQPPQE